MANINIQLDCLIYSSKSFPFVSNYKETIRKLAEISKPKTTNYQKNNLLVYDFIHSFLSDHEVSISNKVEFFDYTNVKDREGAIKKCQDSDLSLFLIEKGFFVKKSINNDVLTDHIKNVIYSSTDYILRNIQHFSCVYILKKESKGKCINRLRVLKDSIMGYTSFARLRWAFKRFIKPFKYLKENPDVLYKDFFNDITFINQINKDCKIIDDIYDAIDTFRSNIDCLILISKLGTMNVVLIEKYQSLVSINTTFNKGNYEKKEIQSRSISESIIINSTINKLPKLFSFLDLNRLLGFQDCFPIYDNPSTFKSDIFYKDKKYDFLRKEPNRINLETPTFKSIYLRFISLDYQPLFKDEPLVFYDYTSLLVGYGTSFDHSLLWQYVNDSNKNKEEYRMIEDVYCRPTEHLYYNNNQATISVIDQSINNSLLPISTSNNIAFKYNSHHQVMIYSFWDFMYSCGALSFGSIGLLTNILFTSYIGNIVKKSRSKIGLLTLQYKLAILSSKIDTSLNHSVYNSKPDSIPTIDAIYEKIGLKRQEEFRKGSMDLNWKSSELMNTQKYSRYGLYFSIVSLIITILSFGMIAKIYRSGKVAKDTFIDLLFGKLGAFHTHKMYLIILIAIIPLVALIILYCHENKQLKTKNNISALNGLTKRELNSKENKN